MGGTAYSCQTGAFANQPTGPGNDMLDGSWFAGTVIANSFAFDLGNTGFHFSGTIGNNAIYGPCSLDIAFAPPTGQAMLNGGWTATPQ